MREKSEHKAADENSWLPPSTFDGYHKIALLEKGGMGEVYLCHDPVLDRPVAIKFIDSVESAKDAHQQFLNEVRATARLQHPNVVTVYRVGDVEAHPYIVSEFVRGENLARIKKPLPWQDALELGLGLCRGLAAAHRRGILHEILILKFILPKIGNLETAGKFCGKITEQNTLDGT